MDADLKKIKKLTLFMKKEGLLSIKSKDFELTLSPTALFQEDPPKPTPEAKEEPHGQLSHEDTLMWSSPTIQSEMT